MRITLNLTPEQEKIYQQYLNRGVNQTPEDIFLQGLSLLSKQKDSVNKIEKTLTKFGIKASESVKQKLAENIFKTNQIEPQKQKSTEELKNLFEQTQSLVDIQNITEDEIQSEIDAYRRGE